MKLYYNEATRTLGTSPTSTTNVGNIRVKRYEDVRVELVTVNAEGEPTTFPVDSTGLLVVKRLGDFTGAAVLLDVEWSVPTTAGAGYVWEFLAAGAGIDAELGTLSEKPFGAEIFIEREGRRLPLPSFSLIIENNYWRENPAPPDPEAPYPLPGEILKRGNILTLELTASMDNVDVDLTPLGLGAAPTAILASVSTRGAVITPTPNVLTLTATSVTVMLSSSPGAPGAVLTLLVIP